MMSGYGLGAAVLPLASTSAEAKAAGRTTAGPTYCCGFSSDTPAASAFAGCAMNRNCVCRAQVRPTWEFVSTFCEKKTSAGDGGGPPGGGGGRAPGRAPTGAQERPGAAAPE